MGGWDDGWMVNPFSSNTILGYRLITVIFNIFLLKHINQINIKCSHVNVVTIGTCLKHNLTWKIMCVIRLCANYAKFK